MIEKSTEELLNLLLNANNQQELDKILDHQPDQKKSFGAYYAYLLKIKNLTSVDVFSKVTFQRTYFYQMLNGLRNPKRNKLLALCTAIHCSLEETQRLLTLGERGILYSKDPRDAIIIYGISKKLELTEINELLYEKGMEILE